MHRNELIIFDCDGVLVDSEMIACRTDARCFNEIGIEITADEIAQHYIGVSAASMLSDIETRFSRKLPEDFGTFLHTRLEAAFAAELKAIAGIETALDRIPVEKCVASSGIPARIEHSLSLTGLLPRFHPHIFSATEVARGKPAPDLFLYAAKRMGADRSASIVVEDSIVGVRAGAAAEIRVIGFTGGSHCRPGHDLALQKAGASAICRHAAELPDAIRAL